jgi:Protein of unknown function (DUF2811)
MTPTISLLAELPETLHSELAQYIDNHPDWDQDRTIAVAISQFLSQGLADDATSLSNRETCLAA